MLDGFVFRLGHKVDRRLVLVLGEMAIYAVGAGGDPAANEPSPERRIARVERDVPGFAPIEKVGVLLKAVRKSVESEPLEHRLIGQVGLSNELLLRPDKA